MKKKLMASLLAASLAVGTQAAFAPAAFADEEPYEIVMILPTLGADPSGLAAVEDAVNAVVTPELGVKLTLSPIFAFNLVSEENLMITSGDKIDLAMVLFTGLGSWVNQGSFLELDDLYEQYGYTFTDDQKDVYSTVGGTPHLDGSYTVFGQVYEGLDIIYTLQDVATDQMDKPTEDVVIESMKVGEYDGEELKWFISDYK